MKENTTNFKIKKTSIANNGSNWDGLNLNEANSLISKNTTEQKEPTHLIKKLKNIVIEGSFSATVPEDYSFLSTIRGPNIPRVIPNEQQTDYGHQMFKYSHRLENVSIDLAYSIKVIEFIKFAPIASVVEDALPAISSPAKAIIEVEEIENSSLVNITIHGNIQIIYDNIFFYTNEADPIGFTSTHFATVVIYLGRSIYYP